MSWWGLISSQRQKSLAMNMPGCSPPKQLDSVGFWVVRLRPVFAITSSGIRTLSQCFVIAALYRVVFIISRFLLDQC